MADALRIGIDVGGTNTDAVALDRSGQVVRWAKSLTTPDPVTGIEAALGQVAGPEPIERVALGTTHAINAILQRRGLRRVAVLRLGAPGTLAVPPLSGWPPDLVEVIRGPVLVARGGVEVDGRTHPLDRTQLVNYIDQLDSEVEAVAIVGTFSSLDPAQELEAAGVVAERIGLPCSLGHDIGGLGLLERENATVLNAALGAVLEGVIEGLERAVAGFARHALLLDPERWQRDDARLRATHADPHDRVRTLEQLARRRRTHGALRWARRRCRRYEHGRVRPGAWVPPRIVRRSPRGRGVDELPDARPRLGRHGWGEKIVDGRLGEESVGAQLVSDALVFGGEIATLTDAAVAAGRAAIGNRALVTERSDLASALDEAETRVTDAIDRMRPSREAVDVVLVGGGAVLLRDALEGARSVLRPAHADVANAIGAALAPVAGEADQVADVGEGERAGAIERLTAQARERAIAAGADPGGLETLWVDEIPLAYLDRPMSRLRAKVVGPTISGR